MEELLDEITPSPKSELRFHWWVLLIWFGVFAIGYAFRFMHWPGSAALRVTGAGGFMAYSLALFFLIKPKNSLLIFANSVSLFWIVLLFWGVFFNHGYPFNENGLIAQGITLAILFVIHYGIFFLVKASRSRKK